MSIPGSASPLLLASTAAAAGGLQIERSLRFNPPDTAYLNRTPAVAGNRQTWTWAGWVKRCQFGTYEHIFNGTGSSPSYAQFYWNPSEQLVFDNGGSGAITTTQVFRDPSAWYHIVLTFDTTQGTAADRMRMYVNGQQITTFSSSSYPTQNSNGGMNQASAHYIGKDSSFAGFYLASIFFIDGQALTPSSFTETDATTGQLIPKTYTGSYGTNGFNLLFADNSAATASTLGKDTSGLGNNFTPNNLSVTAGVGNDSLVDSPTNYGTDTGVGGTVRGNYATWNPLARRQAYTPGVVYSNGNLDLSLAVGSGTTSNFVLGTMGVSSGKWYFEVTRTNATDDLSVGFATANLLVENYSTTYWYSSNGTKFNNGSSSSYGSTTTSGDIIGIAVNLDTGAIEFFKNGTSMGVAFSSMTLGNVYFPLGAGPNGTGTPTMATNFGQRAFAYTAPSGFKALNTANLPATLVTKSNTVFDVVTYTGTGATQTLPNVNSTPSTPLAFSPDFLWFKSRSSANDHVLFDAVRGRASGLRSNGTDSEYTSSAGNDLASFDSAGFTVGAPQNWSSPNGNGNSVVAWAWDAGTGSPVSNPDGSIISQVRANATAGFSVSTWTGTATAGTVGHGLGVAPEFIIVKNRSVSDAWYCYHKSLGNAARIQLNETSAQTTGSSQWNSTSPTSTVYSVGSGSWHASGNLIVSYNFAPVVGYSSFGSYTGNGSSDGSFVYTGFRPRWVMIKRSDSTSNWFLVDTARDTYNVSGLTLFPNTSDSEQDLRSSSTPLDILSNGFKLRTSTLTGGTNINISSATYIYAAFAEAPFNYSRAR